MPLKKIGEVEAAGLTYTVYKGDFINLCNTQGAVVAGLLPNESLIVDQFHTFQVVTDEIAKDFINGREQKRGYRNLRGYNIEG